MMTEDQVAALAAKLLEFIEVNEKHYVDSESNDGEMYFNDIAIAFLQRHGIAKRDQCLADNGDSIWQYPFGNAEAIKLALDRLLKDGKLIGDDFRFGLATTIQERRSQARERWLRCGEWPGLEISE